MGKIPETHELNGLKKKQKTSRGLTIVIAELDLVIKNVSTKKSPGPDSFIDGLYKTFEDITFSDFKNLKRELLITHFMRLTLP